MLTNRSHSPLYLPLLIAVCGILFSVWNALDAASVPCVSAGCTLYQNFSINGYSLWWGGVGIFSLLGLLALTGRAGLGRWLAGLAVLLDCVLRVYGEAIAEARKHPLTQRRYMWKLNY